MKKKKNRGHRAHIIGIVFGLATLIIIIVSLFLIVRQSIQFSHRTHPIFRWRFDLGDKYSESLPESEGERTVHGYYRNISISNVAGKIRIDGWDEDYYLIKFRKMGPTPRSIRELELTIETRGENLIIKRNAPTGNQGTVSFEIFIPERVGHIRAESVSGSIELFGIHPGVCQELRTVSGRIFTDLSSDLTVESTSGSITFLFQGRMLTAQTVSGSIGGTISNIEPGASMELGSVSGSIKIRADERFSAEVSLRSVSGRISCDFPMTVQREERGRLEGKIGEGLGSLKVKTTSGAIQIGKN